MEPNTIPIQPQTPQAATSPAAGIVKQSYVRYQQLFDSFSVLGVDAQLTFGADDVLTLKDQKTGETYFAAGLPQIERVYVYDTGLIITIAGMQYKLNFTRPVNPAMAVLLLVVARIPGLLLGYLFAMVGNDALKIRNEWIKLFKQKGAPVHRDRYFRFIGIGIGISLVLLLMFVAFLYIVASTSK